jgi:DNA polymerase-3 subunit epsilon
MYTIIDIETTGGSKKNGKITEIAAFRHDGNKLIDSYTTLVNPEMPIPPFVAKLTGITNKMVADAPIFETVAPELDRFTTNAVFVAHNAQFDYGFIREAFRQIGMDFRRKTLCTVKLSRQSFPGLPSYSLGKITKQLNINLNGAHRAAADAKATLHLFEKIIGKQGQIGLFESHFGIDQLSALPSPHINAEFLKSIPDENGVFKFFDKNDELIYVKRSPQVLSAISDKLTPDDTANTEELRKEIYRIDYEICDSPLLAQLLECHVAVSEKPKFNHGRFSMKAFFGLYFETINGKEIGVVSRRKKKDQKPKMVFGNFHEGMHYLKSKTRDGDFKIIEKPYGRGKLKGIVATGHSGKNLGAILPYNSYLLIDEGRQASERLIVMVQCGMVLGYGFFDVSQPLEHISEEDLSVRFGNYPEMEMVMQKFIEKKRFERMVVVGS